VVEGFREKEVGRIAGRDFAPGTDVVGDGLSWRPAVGKAGCPHRPMVTGSGRRAAGRAPFRRANTTLGTIETAPAGTDRHVSPRHARLDLTGFACRFDRRYRPDSIVERLARAAMRTAPRPYRVVAAEA
jgi:hypothetical protein